jgi:four helix bundle protein
VQVLLCRPNAIAIWAGFLSGADGHSFAADSGMAGFKKFEDIIAWQLAHQLKLHVDELLAKPEFKRKFKFVDQLSDAVRSPPRNIAEGHMRGFKHKEFAQFLRIARGSLGEVLNHLLDAYEQRLISEEELRSLEHLARRALKATTSLIRYLESTPDPKRT